MKWALSLTIFLLPFVESLGENNDWTVALTILRSEAMRSRFDINQIGLLCRMNNKRKSELGRLSKIMPTFSLTSVPKTRLFSSLVVCTGDFSAEDIREFWKMQGQVATRHPIIFIREATLNISINQRVFFISKSGEVSETYSINGEKISTILGHFDHVKDVYTPSYGIETNFLKRRANFRGLKLLTLLEVQSPFLVIDPLPNFGNDDMLFSTKSGDKLAKVERKSAKGLFFDIILLLEKDLNFTCDFAMRADRIWGKRLDNGSFTGLVSSIYKGEADLIGTSLTLQAVRSEAVKYLWPLGKSTPAIFIKGTFT